MKGIICLCLLMSVHSTLQQFSYQQPFTAIPSEACAGKDTVNLTCEILFAVNNGEPQLRNAIMTRNGVIIDQTTPDHMFLLSENHMTIGVIISSITIEDRGVVYTCNDPNSPPNFGSSLTLNVTVSPMNVSIVIVPTPLNNTSFNVSWTIPNPDYYRYMVTWTNMNNNMMDNMTFPENTSSYMVTGLNGVDNYNVSVTADNSCGMMMSDPITVYDQPKIVMNVSIGEDITSESFVVLWDKVMDIFTITYNVTWYNDSGIIGMITTNNPPYTVNTGLAANTSYNVTVVAINTCCGAGPVSDVVEAMTDDEPPPSSTSVPSSSMPTVTSSMPTITPSMSGMFMPTPTTPAATTDGDNGGDSTLIIVIVVVIVCVIVIIGSTIFIICCIKHDKCPCIKKDDCPCFNKGSKDSETQGLQSPTSISEGHKASKASVQPTSTIPHQPAPSGEEYAVTFPKQQQQQPPPQQYAVVDKSKKVNSDSQPINYAELQELPSSGNVPSPNQGPTSTYAMVA